MQNADDLVTIPVERKIRDRLISRNTGNQTLSKVIEIALNQTENTISFETSPEVFEDYNQIQTYFGKFQAEINRHARLGIDRVSVRIFIEKPYGCFDIFYNKDVDGKYRRSRT